MFWRKRREELSRREREVAERANALVRKEQSLNALYEKIHDATEDRLQWVIQQLNHTNPEQQYDHMQAVLTQSRITAKRLSDDFEERIAFRDEYVRELESILGGLEARKVHLE